MSPDPSKKKKVKRVQLNIRVPIELRRRVGVIAAARDESLDKFVGDVLDERTKQYVDDVESIAGRERAKA